MSKIKGKELLKDLIYLHNEYNWSGEKIERILNLKPYTTRKWVKKGKVPYNSKSAKVLIHLLEIHKLLESIFEKTRLQLAWLNSFNPQLQRVPICIMSESLEGLVFVRQYLEYISRRG